jgi:hypothetical protein
MKKIKNYVFLTAIIIFTLIVYSIIVFKGYEKLNTFFSGAIGIIQVFFSIIITYLLYDRFGTTKKILDKQNDLIIDFIEKYRNLGIYLYIMDDNKLIHIYFNPGKNLIKQIDKKYLKRNILFPTGTLGHQHLRELNKLKNNPLFPSELIPNISAFEFFSLTAEIGDFDRNNYAFLSFERVDYHVDLNQKNYMKPNNEKVLLEDFLTNITSSINSIEYWVNRESSIKIKLNFD